MDDPEKTGYSEITEANTIFKQVKPFSETKEIKRGNLAVEEEKIQLEINAYIDEIVASIPDKINYHRTHNEGKYIKVARFKPDQGFLVFFFNIPGRKTKALMDKLKKMGFKLRKRNMGLYLCIVDEEYKK
jgi:hypothetical protein